MSDDIEIEVNSEKVSFSPVDLPPLFIQWQSEARLRMFKLLGEAGAGQVTVQPAHLAVLATWTVEPASTAFPVNLTTKGIGLVPAQEYLEEITQGLEQARLDTEGLPVEETLPARVEVVKAFYERIETMDTKVLGGLEIFEGQTSKNLEVNPYASLLYTGEAPRYPSFQFNCIVEKIDAGAVNPYYRFLLAARELFAMDTFHLHQTHYPFAYLFHVVEVKDKTPFPRQHGHSRGE
jgi:hypothetical protein